MPIHIIEHWTFQCKLHVWQFKNSQQNVSSDWEYWKHFIFIQIADIKSKSIFIFATILVRNYLALDIKHQYSWSSAHWWKIVDIIIQRKGWTKPFTRSKKFISTFVFHLNLDPFCFEFKQTTNRSYWTVYWMLNRTSY